MYLLRNVDFINRILSTKPLTRELLKYLDYLDNVIMTDLQQLPQHFLVVKPTFSSDRILIEIWPMRTRDPNQRRIAKYISGFNCKNVKNFDVFFICFTKSVYVTIVKDVCEYKIYSAARNEYQLSKSDQMASKE